MGAAVALLLWLAPVTLGVLPALADDWTSPYEVFTNSSGTPGAYDTPIDQSPQDIRLSVEGFHIGNMPDPDVIPTSSDGEMELTRGGAPASIGFSGVDEDFCTMSGTITVEYRDEPAYGYLGSANFESQVVLSGEITQVFTIYSSDQPAPRTEQYQLTQSDMGLTRVINGVQYLMFPLYTSDGGVGYTGTYLYLELTAVRGMPGATTNQPPPQTEQQQTDAYWSLTEVVVPADIDSAQHEYGEYAIYFNELGLLMLDAASGSGVEFFWSELPERIVAGQERAVEVAMGVFPFEGSSWVSGTAFALEMDVVNTTGEKMYAEYSEPLFVNYAQSGEPLEVTYVFSPAAENMEQFYREGNQLHFSFVYEGDIDHVVRYIYQYIPPETFQSTVPGSSGSQDSEGQTPGAGAEDDGLPPAAIAAIAVAGAAIAGGGIAGLARMRARNKVAPPEQAPPAAQPSTSISEYERIERETRARHAEMDRVIGAEELERHRAGTTAQDQINREQMARIAEAQKSNDYKQRKMQKYGVDTVDKAMTRAGEHAAISQRMADTYRRAGHTAAALEVIAHLALATTNASADVISRVPGLAWYRPVYRMGTSVAGETATSVANMDVTKQTGWQAAKSGVVKGAVKGSFEAARGFMPSAARKGLTTFLGDTLGEMSGAYMDGKDIYKATAKGARNGLYNSATRAVSDTFTGRSYITDTPSLYEGGKQLAGSKEVRRKVASYFLRRFGKSFI